MTLSLLSILVVSIVLVNSPHPAAAQNGWTLSTDDPHVGIGTFGSFNVSGPAGSPFQVNVTGQPFNYSHTIWTEGYRLPLAETNGNNTTQNLSSGPQTTFLNIAIPTDLLTLGAYQITVFDGFRVVALSIMTVIDPINGTGLLENISNLQNIVNNQAGLIAGLGTSLSNDELTIFGLEVTVIACVFVMILYGTLAEIVRRIPGALKRTRGGIENTFSTDGPFRIYISGSYQRRHAPLTNPLSVYFSGYCDTCKVGRFPKMEIIDHLQKKHGLKNPIEGVHYAADTKLLKRAVAEAVPAEATRRLRKAQKNFDLKSDLPP